MNDQKDIMQLYSADATTFKKNKNFFAYKNFKKLPSKVAYLWPFGFFFPMQSRLPKTAQN